MAEEQELIDPRRPSLLRPNDIIEFRLAWAERGPNKERSDRPDAADTPGLSLFELKWCV